MGKEYQMVVPEAYRAAVAKGLQEWLPDLLLRCDPRAKTSFPNVIVHVIPEGVFLCDTLMDDVVANRVMREVMDLLLFYSDQVIIVEP